MNETATASEYPAWFAWLGLDKIPLGGILAEYPMITALILVIISYVVARIAGFVWTKSTGTLTARTRTDLDDEIFRVLKTPIITTVFMLGLSVAVHSLDISPAIKSLLLKVLASIVLLSWFRAAFPVLNLFLGAVKRNRHKLQIIQKRTVPLFRMIGNIILIAFGSYTLLLIWDIDITAWLASAGVIGIAVGFAAKDTLANLFSGFFIVADSPYKVGDYIVLDTGERGEVDHVGLRSTRIKTRDDVEITIPNAVIANAKIVNESGGGSEASRIRIKVGVSYDADLDDVCEVLEAVANDIDDILKVPSARVRCRGFGDSSVDFELMGWVAKPADRGRISHEVYMEVFRRFRKENIEIPFPQRVVHWAPGGAAENSAAEDST